MTWWYLCKPIRSNFISNTALWEGQTRWPHLLLRDKVKEVQRVLYVLPEITQLLCRRAEHPAQIYWHKLQSTWFSPASAILRSFNCFSTQWRPYFQWNILKRVFYFWFLIKLNKTLGGGSPSFRSPMYLTSGMRVIVTPVHTKYCWWLFLA